MNDHKSLLGVELTPWYQQKELCTPHPTQSLLPSRRAAAFRPSQDPDGVATSLCWRETNEEPQFGFSWGQRATGSQVPW